LDFVLVIVWPFWLLSIFSAVLRWGKASAQQFVGKADFQVDAEVILIKKVARECP
jgi:hypothetical protein